MKPPPEEGWWLRWLDDEALLGVFSGGFSARVTIRGPISLTKKRPASLAFSTKQPTTRVMGFQTQFSTIFQIFHVHSHSSTWNSSMHPAASQILSITVPTHCDTPCTCTKLMPVVFAFSGGVLSRKPWLEPRAERNSVRSMVSEPSLSLTLIKCHASRWLRRASRALTVTSRF